MSKLKVLISCAMMAIPVAGNSAGFVVSVTDAAGNTQTQDLPIASFPTPAPDGSFNLEADFDSVASGSLTGTVQSIQADRSPLGPAFSFSGAASNIQPTVVSVSLG